MKIAKAKLLQQRRVAKQRRIFIESVATLRAGPEVEERRQKLSDMAHQAKTAEFLSKYRAHAKAN